MKKQAKWFLLIGGLCTSFTVFTRQFITTPESIEDFLKGFGVVFLVAGCTNMITKKKTV